MSLFILIALSIWSCLNGYVFWRLGGLPGIAGRVPGWLIWCAAIVCCVSLPASRWLLKSGLTSASSVLENFSMTWVGVVFLLFVCFLVVDCVTLGGLLLTAHAPFLRAGSVVVAMVLTVAALVQGNRAPVIHEQVVVLPGLPRERDGLRVVFVSDLHLGSQIGRTWLKKLVGQIAVLKPDLIAIGGDLVDHDADLVRPMVPELRALHAPLGVWSVLGNHDSYGGADDVARLMRDAGFHVLHDESGIAVPGLRIAGVDDLGVRGRTGPVEAAIHEAIGPVKKAQEGCIFLSHTPVGISEAAQDGAGLMLCGHTHGGQIWPFNYLVALRYPELVGRFNHDPMTLIISRGAGTWGPRMRLWQPGEILLITLRAP